MQTFQKLEDHFAGPEIQVAGWFIGQQNGGYSHEGSGQHNTLLLSSG
jgi:hypothetical protein